MKVLISGAGIAGTALAFWLGKIGYDVTVVERFSTLRTNGLQLDLRGHGIQILKLMGLDAAFKAKAAPEQGIQFVNSAGRRLAYFGSNTSGKGRQAFTSEYEIMRGELCRLFHDASVGAGNVKYVFGASIKEMENGESGVTVRFSNDKVERFDLVVGADGQWSRTRRMLSGSTESPDKALRLLPGMYAGYFTTPMVMREDEGFDSTLYIAPHGRNVMTRRSDPAFIQVYMMCSAESTAIRSARRGDTAQEKAAFAENYKGAGWITPQLVDGMQKSDDFYCERIGLVKQDSWHSGRVVLVGDAAYCPSVVTGMGTTCGVVGAYILAGELSKLDPGAKSRHRELPDALAAYEAVFRPFMDQVQKGVGEDSMVSKLFMPTSAIGVAMLNLALRIITFLGISFDTGSFLKEDIRDWEVPDYDMLHRA